MVTKSNELITASYNLSLNEQRLILACASQVDSRKHLIKNNKFSITVKEFSELFRSGTESSYTELKETADNLFERSIIQIKGASRYKMRWIYLAKYIEKEGRIEVGFSPEICPYLSSLKKKFTTYKLSEIADLKSGYSIRLYEMLMQFKSTGILVISLEDFRERLGLGTKYPRFDNFKKNVIEKAVQEISIKTNYDVEYEVEKRGRTVKNLHFSFNPRIKNTVKPLTNPILPI